MRLSSHNKGFTLLEIVAVLVIAGILAAVAGMGIIRGSQAFVFNKEATALSQKAELAMDRLRRSLENITDISAATSSSVSLERLSGEDIINEIYSVSGNNLQINSDEDNAGTNTLTDNVSALSLAYKMADDSTWTTSNALEDLARIEISLTMSGPGGATLTFANHVVPRNTYMPDVQRRYYPAGSTIGSGTGCFVATAAFGTDSDSRVFTLSQFRDNILSKIGAGRYFLEFYEQNGPGMAQILNSHAWLKPLVKLILLPASGFAFMALYFPWGLAIMAAFSWILARVLLSIKWSRVSKKSRFQGATGAVLLSLIIVMTIMAAIGAGMVSMYSASNISSAIMPYSARAHYIAESGLRYAGWILNDNVDDDSFIATDLHGKTFPVDNDSFELEIFTYWYDIGTNTTPTGSLVVSPWGGLPDKMKSIPETIGGYVIVEKSGGAKELVRYTNLSTTESGNLVFSLASTPTGTYKSGGRVLPAAKIGAGGTIRAENLGDSAGDNLQINLNNLSGVQDTFAFPKMMGIITLTDSSNKDWYIMYDQVDYDNDRLVGIRNCPGRAPLPGAGIVVNAGAPVQLERYAMFSSKGTAGSGQFAASETIMRSQAMGTVGMFRGVEGGMDFDSPDDINNINPILGTAEIVDNALKITETAQTYSYTNPAVYQQESLMTVDWQGNLIDTLNLEEIWERSSKLLSYDLQVKIKFTESEDDTTAPYVNVPGNYMPGLSFRTYCSGGSCNYYGLSYMRGIQGWTVTDTGGCGDTEYVEDDDITDGFFQDYGSNAGAAVTECIDGFEATSWNCTPPKDGIPYLVFWQKYMQSDGSGCGAGVTSPFDWLSYMSLVNATAVQVYYYKPVTCYWTGPWYNRSRNYVNWPGGWYEGLVPGDPRNSTLDICGDWQGNVWAREGPYTAWKLSDKYGLFRTSTVEGVTVLGIPGEVIIRDPSTVNGNYTALGTPVPDVAFVADPDNSSDAYQAAKGARNYRIYPKEWATLMIRIVEMEGDYDCDGDNDRVNAIAAYAASPNTNGGSPYNLTKDANRRAYARGAPVKWPEDDEYFTMATWDDYTSKTITKPAGCLGSYDVKLVEKGQDSEGDDVVAFSGTFTTEGYDFTSNVEEVEFGLHTLGISAEAGATGSDKESVYFDDLYWSFWEGGALGIMPGVQQQ